MGWKLLEARAGIEPAMEVLQTSALPLGHLAIVKPSQEKDDTLAGRFPTVKKKERFEFTPKSGLLTRPIPPQTIIPAATVSLV